MRAFYGDRFSPNMTRTPENFLICHNVPIARTGTQDYLPKELGIDGNEIVHVHRYEEDVFSPSALASFEGKPVTDNHPPQEVTSDNYAAYMKGVTQNVRRNGDYIVADLVVHDAQLIAEIEAGKREISCGYDCAYVKDGNDYKQTHIIGNHVAVVDNGRAGHAVSIKDEAIKAERGKRKMPRPSILQRMFAKFVEDADPAEVMEAAEAVKDAESDDKDEKKEVKEVDDKKSRDEDIEELAETVDSLARTVDSLASLVLARRHSNLKGYKSTLDELEEELTKDEDEEEDIEEAEMVEDEEENEESRTVEPEEIQDDEDTTEESKPEKASDKAIALAAIRAVKPIIAALPAKQRKRANDAMGKAIKKALGGSASQPLAGGYGALMRRKTTDGANADPRAFGENCRKRNPHVKK